VAPEKVSFGLQQINITVDLTDIPEKLLDRIQRAKASYDWLYQNERQHDVVVKVLIKMDFKPPNE